MIMAPSQSQGINSPQRGATNDNNNINNSTTSNSTTSKSPPVQKYLTNCKSLYSCIYCRTHLANHDELVSRSFQGNHGRAYLFNSVINISCGPAVQRELNTGSHAVADIFCENCETTLGWKYEKAYVETQKYKEGKYIIELAHVVRENRHLELDKGEMLFFGGSLANGKSNNNNGNNHHHRNSLSPSSPSGITTSGHWSSPGSRSNNGVDSSSSSFSSSSPPSSSPSSPPNEDNSYDDELIFPFYDDLCSNRTSYPSSLSSSQHNRLRRSLYLDSTPYDWKYSTTPENEEFFDCYTDDHEVSSTSTNTTNDNDDNNNDDDDNNNNTTNMMTCTSDSTSTLKVAD